MTYDYDLFVIGGGSGGVRAARMVAAKGARVGLAEESRMGGTCVIRGCVPKKLMVFASEFAALVQEARGYGWSIAPGAFDWRAFKAKLDAELDRLEAVYRRLLDNAGVTIHDARARLDGPNAVVLATGERFTARQILIATGGHPQRPDTPGAELGIVSDDMFNLPQLPGSLLIVGGGYIACEFAGIMNGLGVAVTQFYRGAEILRGFDDEARRMVAGGMRAQGIDIRTGTEIVSMQRDEAGIRVTASDGVVAHFDQVLFATGRSPNTAGLGLETAGIAIGAKGEIPVDAYSATVTPNIHAIGDVTDRVNLTPVAIREGMAYAETVFGGNPTPVDHRLIPTAVFTQPEFGTVGLAEEEARKVEPIEVYSTTFRPMRTSFAGTADKVLMKLVVSQKTRRILGCHIVAPQAGEMIQLVGIAVRMGATKEDFDRTMAVHPTLAEELVTMKEPVRRA